MESLPSFYRWAVLIPAYNAELTLREVLGSMPAQVPEILVVDDGSTDQTAAAAQSFNNVEVISHTKNCGKGAAVKTGIAQAKIKSLDFVITLDADGQHDPKEILKLYHCYQQTNTPLIVGNRFSTDYASMPLPRRCSNRMSSALISFLCRQRLCDIQCGFRLYHVDTFLSLNPKENGFAMETEIIVKAAKQNIKIAQVPVSCIYSPDKSTSHYHPIKDSIRIASMVWKTVVSNVFIGTSGKK